MRLCSPCFRGLRPFFFGEQTIYGVSHQLALRSETASDCAAGWLKGISSVYPPGSSIRFIHPHPPCNMAHEPTRLSPPSGDPVAGQKRKRLPRALLACESCRSRKLRVLLPSPLPIPLRFEARPLMSECSAINCRLARIAPVRRICFPRE